MLHLLILQEITHNKTGLKQLEVHFIFLNKKNEHYMCGMKNAPKDEVKDDTGAHCNFYTDVFFLYLSVHFIFTLYLSNALQTFCSLKQANHSRSSDYMSWTRKSVQSHGLYL